MTDALGLRERKRLATRRALRLAVMTMATERGLDGVTIDEIAASADVSPRTFFNYFSSKDEAIFASDVERVTPEAMERFVTGRGTVVSDLVVLLLGQIPPEELDRELLAVRRELLKRRPELAAARISRVQSTEYELVRLVDRRLARDNHREDPDDVSPEARMLTLATVAAFRSAWINWSVHEDQRDLEWWFREALQTIGRDFGAEQWHSTPR